MARCKQPTAHAVRPRVDNRGLSGMRFWGGEDSLAGIILPASQCRQVPLPVSGQNLIVDGDAAVARSQEPGARRAGQQKALVGEVAEAEEAENSLARRKS